MKLLWKQLILLFFEQYLRYGANQNAQTKPEFIIFQKTFLKIVTSQMALFEKKWKYLTTKFSNRQFFHFYQIYKSFHKPIDNNWNTVSTTSKFSLPSNTSACPNDGTYISFEWKNRFLRAVSWTQLQNLTHISPVKYNSKGTNANNESDILIESLQDTVHILKKISD